MSEPVSARQQRYQGTFLFRDLPPGVYRAAVYRTGARTIFVEPVTVKARETVQMKWDLKAETPAGNLVRNADLKIRWTFQGRPEHWSYDGRMERWISDAILIEGGKSYRAVIEASPAAKVSLQSMSEVWQPPVSVQELSQEENPLVAPAGAKLAQLAIEGAEDPSTRIQGVFLAPR
ncbi:MAG: peptidase associated/transthyretin-like domain-containing protein [Steroidobacteraceae bacterium]